MLPLARSIATLALAGPPAFGQCSIQKLTAPVPEGTLTFGLSVALDGDTLLVGAPRHDGAGTDTGIVYAYQRVGPGFVHTGELLAGGFPPAMVDYFGWTLALEGDEAWVGAFADDPAGSASGAAFVFQRAGGAWSQAQALVAGDAQPDDRFGRALAFGGAVGAVGAPREDQGGLDAGAVYVFERAGATWVEAAKLVAHDAHADGAFGESVAASGELLLVGAPDQNSGAAVGAGTAYVFEKVGGSWVETARLADPAGALGARFGHAVALGDGLAFVGAPRAVRGGISAGAVYVFARGAAGWALVAALEDPLPADGDYFGRALSLSGRRLAVGAADGLDADEAGAAFVFEQLPSGFELVARLTDLPSSPVDHFGSALALDGEGLAVAAPLDDADANNSGSVRVFQFPVTARPYCLCDAGAPCGNEDPFAGCADGSGTGAHLAACGSTSVSADDLALRLEGAGANPALAALWMGAAVDRAPFGDGLRCVAGGAPGVFVLRGLAHPFGAGLEFGPGLVANAAATLPPAGQILAGDTWRFQAVYLGSAGGCASDVNTSNALSVEFGP